MTSVRTQQTIASRATVEGFGYWSGRDVRVEFRPAAPGAGISFVRGDLNPGVRIPARAELRVDVPRRTNLRCGHAEVEMVEHILAALAGLNIDNCEVWTNSSEMPGLDGSAAPFVDALLRAGLVQQGVEASYLTVSDAIRIADGESWIEARPSGSGQFCVEYQLDYPQASVIGRQVARVNLTPERFRSEVAPCRTFLMESEAEQLRRQGLGLRVTPRDLLVFDDQGPLQNRLRFPNECARHKLLDVLGDLALTGCRIEGEITAHRSGHRLHVELARQLVSRFASTALRASA